MDPNFSMGTARPLFFCSTTELQEQCIAITRANVSNTVPDTQFQADYPKTD